MVPLGLIPHALRKQVSDRAPEALLRFGANEGLQRLADVVRVIDEAKKILEPRAVSLRKNGVKVKLDATKEAAETGVEKQGDGAVKRRRARPGEGRARIAAQDATRAELAK